MAHHHTILGQILQLIPRFEFEKAVEKHNAERGSKGFKSWTHFVSMLFGQLAGIGALRGIEAGLASMASKLYHLGIRPVSRSTLSYANAHRPNALFLFLFNLMLSTTVDVAPKHKFRFKNPLYSLDATTIELCLSLYDWAKFRTTKGAVKLHVKLNHDGYLPSFVVLTEGKVQEQRVAPRIPFEAADVLVFDRGYSDFGWLASLSAKGIYFITRMKKNVVYRVVERTKVKNKDIIKCDQIIELTGMSSRKKYPFRLRRIRVKDRETGKEIVLITNQMHWSPKTIAAVYKDRWQIEIFFKTLKQVLKVKSFVGTSRNALLSQIWIALIAYLMLSYLKYVSRFAWSLYTFMSILPANLFAVRDLMDWLNAPFHPKSHSPPDAEQLLLPLI